MSENDFGISVCRFSRYRVFTNGIVVDFAKNKPLNHVIESGSGIVIVNVQNDSWKWTKVSVARLVLSAYRPYKCKWWDSYAIVLYKDGDKTNVNLDNLDWRFNNYRPLFYPKGNIRLDTFVSIPGFSNYEINCLGNHRNKKTLVSLSTGHVSDTGYLKVRIIDDSGISRNVGIHRLLALTFLQHPVDTSNLLVNHKDGNKLNLNVNNLEWVTHQENNIHAWETGLQIGRNGSILVMNCKTREVIKFTNFTKLLRDLDLPETSVRRWLDEKDENLRPHQGIFIKYDSDDRDWPDENQTDFKKERREGISVSIKNITTGEVEDYRYVNEVARKFGVDRGIIDRLLDQSEVMPYQNWLIRYTSDTPWPTYTESEIDHLSQKMIPGKRILVTDPKTNVSRIYSSIDAFSKTCNLSKYHIRNALNGNNRTSHEISYAV